MKRLVIASGNRGKIAELTHLLHDQNWSVAGLESCPGIVMPPEDGGTFIANARIKAGAVRNYFHGMDQNNMPYILADDSGLVCEGLRGDPGVESANYAGPQASDAANNQKLMTEFAKYPEATRRAQYECVLILLKPCGTEIMTHEKCQGEILDAPKGQGGFGYDPYFFLPELGMTMAELPLTTKNRISHRGKALAQLLKKIQAEDPRSE